MDRDTIPRWPGCQAGLGHGCRLWWPHEPFCAPICVSLCPSLWELSARFSVTRRGWAQLPVLLWAASPVPRPGSQMPLWGQGLGPGGPAPELQPCGPRGSQALRWVQHWWPVVTPRGCHRSEPRGLGWGASEEDRKEPCRWRPWPSQGPGAPRSWHGAGAEQRGQGRPGGDGRRAGPASCRGTWALGLHGLGGGQALFPRFKALQASPGSRFPGADVALGPGGSWGRAAGGLRGERGGDVATKPEARGAVTC